VDLSYKIHTAKMKSLDLFVMKILEKKWEYNGTVHQLFIDFKKTCDSVRFSLSLEYY
jgi:hypothetical protein